MEDANSIMSNIALINLYLLYAWFLFGTVYQVMGFLLKLLILTRAQQLLRLASVWPQ